MKVSVLTLGCKVNQYESDSMMQRLSKLNYEVSNKLNYADIYILNTCAVTNEAEHKSREYIAKFNKLNPNAKVFVCGCASQDNAEQFLKIKNVVSVIGTSGKNKVEDVISGIGNSIKELPKIYENFDLPSTTRTRAYLKVQDGCNNFCSYCIIPYVRGRSRSRDLKSIHLEAEELAKNSNELVVTGINVSDFKVDEKPNLSALMNSLSDVNARIRLSSFEINAIDENLLNVLKQMPNFCPQFHLSMQSGCTRILKLMNRHYTAEQFLKKVELIKSYFPNCSISTYIIVGFPTETDEDFLETLETVKKAGFFFIHIFPYSKRNGTVAEKMKMVNDDVVKQRVKQLAKIENELNQEYLISQIGKTQTVLTESVKNEFMTGHTEQFVKVYLPKTVLKHKFFKVKLIKPFKDGMTAEIIE